MTADIVQLEIYKEFSNRPRHSRGRRVLEEVAKREKTALLRAELQTELAMRAWEESFFVTREEVGL